MYLGSGYEGLILRCVHEFMEQEMLTLTSALHKRAGKLAQPHKPRDSGRASPDSSVCSPMGLPAKVTVP